MKRYRIPAIFVLAVCMLLGGTVFCLSSGGGFAAGPAETVFMLDALRPLQRPVSRFMHDEHNEKAGVEDCYICHHAYTEDGVLDTGDSSEGNPCSDCHMRKTGGDGTPLVKAYHMQCKSCHERQGAGPRVCGECHTKALQ